MFVFLNMHLKQIQAVGLCPTFLQFKTPIVQTLTTVCNFPLFIAYTIEINGISQIIKNKHV